MGMSDKERIAWAEPDLGPSDYAALKECFDSSWIAQGCKVRQFEEAVAALSDRKYGIAVNSGSSALISVLLALGVRPGHEVVIPGLAFVAVPNAVIMTGAVPVLADVSVDTGTLCKASVARALSPLTSAVIAIDYSGFAGDWVALSALCRDAGVPLIIDSASSFLAARDGSPAGTSGVAAIFSFHTAKAITTGEGGAVVTDDPDLADRLRRIRNYGEIAGEKYRYDALGGNFRMTDIAASLGLSQLARHQVILDARRRVLAHYLSHTPLAKCALPGYRATGQKPNGFTFTVTVKERLRFRESLQRAGIDTRVLWPYCVNEQSAYTGFDVRTGDNLEGCHTLAATSLSLPVHTGLDMDQVDRVAQAFKTSMAGYV